MLRHSGGCVRWWLWAAGGCAAAAGALTLGAPVLALTALGVALLAARRQLHRSAFGFLAGCGAPLLYVAWLNRGGAGVSCWRTAAATGCDEHLDPLPWLLVGVTMVIGGTVAYARRTRAH